MGHVYDSSHMKGLMQRSSAKSPNRGEHEGDLDSKSILVADSQQIHWSNITLQRLLAQRTAEAPFDLDGRHRRPHLPRPQRRAGVGWRGAGQQGRASHTDPVWQQALDHRY